MIVTYIGFICLKLSKTLSAGMAFPGFSQTPIYDMVRTLLINTSRSEPMKKILLVSNDHAAQKTIEKTLTFNNILVTAVNESKKAWNALVETKFEFVMIDTNLKEESGLSLYKTLRQVGNNIPVMMLGEGNFDKIMLKNLSHENYDYILKPIRYRTLKIKVNHFLRSNKDTNKNFMLGRLEIDTRQKLLVYGEKLLQLSSLELDIMMMLAKKSGQVIDPRKIAYLIESEGRFYKDSAGLLMSTLKEKLKRLEAETLDICFIKDKGYKLSL